MRLVLILIALLALSVGEARADVFVPADPPTLRSAQCSAGAGDVVAAGTAAGKLRVSVGGGGWHELVGLSGCPVVAAAADGTLAIANVDNSGSDVAAAGLAIRGPGGAFRPPVVVGEDPSDVPSVAVAPGGWVAATWVTRDVGLTVLIVRPDGALERTVLEPTTDAPDGPLILDHRVGIDAGGNVTIVWRRFDARKERLRVARGVGGAAPVAGADLPGATEGVGGLSVAIAPGGGTLIAWATEDGVRAMVDGQPPQLLDPTSVGVLRLAGAIADDGTALLAYMSRGDEVVAAERVGGTWLRPRVLAPGSVADRIPSSDASEDVQRDVQAVVASGGRAAVAWSTVPDEETQVFGLTGQLGGAWGAPTRLSSITRTAWGFNLALDAAGVPRAVWSEAGLGVRGASLAPARLDVSPPTVTARLPSRVAPTVDGNVAVTVRVRCTEACDARLAFTGGEHDRGHVVRALEPGRTAALRLQASDALQYELIVNRRSRRLRLQVLVTDRAGNLVRRSVTLRVRVLEPPIRTFKVAPGRKFGMDTPTGNRAVARFVNDMIETIARGGVSSRTLARRYTRGLEAIARKFGPDYTYSDEVRSAIYDALWLPLARTHHDVGWVLGG